MSLGRVGYLAEVDEIDPSLAACDQEVQLVLVEHAQPLGPDESREASQECCTLSPDLGVQTIVRDPVDVLHPVLVRHRYVATARHQILDLHPNKPSAQTNTAKAGGGRRRAPPRLRTRCQ